MRRWGRRTAGARTAGWSRLSPVTRTHPRRGPAGAEAYGECGHPGEADRSHATRSRTLCSGPIGSGSRKQTTATTTVTTAAPRCPSAGEAAGQDQAGGDQREEGQRRSEGVDDAGGAELLPGYPPGAPGGKPIAGSALKTPPITSPAPNTASSTGPATAPRPPRRCGAAAYAKIDAEQPGDDEVRTLHPAERAVGEQADRVPDEVEAVAGEDLDDGGRDEQRTGDDPGEQCAAAYARLRCGRRWRTR